MKVLKAVFFCKEGRIAVVSIILGIVIASVGGNIAKGFISTDIIVMIGCVLSVVGTQMLSRLIIAYRNQFEQEDEENE